MERRTTPPEISGWYWIGSDNPGWVNNTRRAIAILYCDPQGTRSTNFCPPAHGDWFEPEWWEGPLAVPPESRRSEESGKLSSLAEFGPKCSCCGMTKGSGCDVECLNDDHGHPEPRYYPPRCRLCDRICQGHRINIFLCDTGLGVRSLSEKEVAVGPPPSFCPKRKWLTSGPQYCLHCGKPQTLPPSGGGWQWDCVCPNI